MDAQGAYVPVYKLMKENNIPFSTSEFIGGAASYYENNQGNLDSMPFNSSTPVLYYNKTELANAGITTPPATWSQVQADADLLAQKGQKCALTSSGAYVMWTDLEEFAMWNGLQYATNNNGYSSINNVSLNITAQPFVDHMAMLGSMAQKGEYVWNGTSTSTVPLFTNGTCAMYEQSSASLTTIAAGAQFPFGVAPLPTVDGSNSAPQNTVVGGASMWVMAGQPSNTYAGDAQFIQFLKSPTTQSYWASHTGYVPVTKAGSQLLGQQNFYASHPNDLVAVNELNNKPPTAYSKGIRLGYLPEVRAVEASAIADILSGKQTAQAALASARTQGNAILQQFAAQYNG